MASKKNTLRLQKALKSHGFDPGPIDGIMGEKTRAAYAAWSAWSISAPNGIDIAHWQSRVDFKKLEEEEVEFVIVKACHGTSKAKMFAEHYSELRRTKMVRGVYCWFVPAVNPIQQAEAWVKIVNDFGKGTLPVMIDVERDSAGADGVEGTADDIVATQEMIARCAGRVAQLTGRKPIIYSYGPYLDQRNIELGDYPLAIADYRTGPPTIPPGYKGTYLIHQFAGNNGRQEGVVGAVDLDRFNGTFEDLKRTAGL